MNDLLIFSHSVEALRPALGPLLDAQALARLRALGIDYTKPLEPAYPLATWRKVVDFAGELVAPGQPYDRQQYALGSRFITAYAETFIGRATLPLMRVLGPRRMLERLARTFRTGNNYSETKLTQHAPNEFELWCNHVQNPSFYRGMLQTGLAHAGVTGVQVTTTAIDRSAPDEAHETGAAFRISW
ncbi:MAG: DUF2378 family protein [Archangium sp.]|nr:DUF2378 family protein [Archangium sp.]